MLAVNSGQPSFPDARAGRPRPDCPGPGCRVLGVGSWLSAGPPWPVPSIYHQAPRISGPVTQEALPAVRCILENTGKLCRLSPPLPQAQEKILWEWPASKTFDGS